LGLRFDRLFIYDIHPNFTFAEWGKKSLASNSGIVYSDGVSILRGLDHPPKWVMFLDDDEFLAFELISTPML
jgi:glycosyltransferase involved in cell wall biosynthesis